MTKNKLEEEVKHPSFIEQAKIIIDDSFNVKIEDSDFSHTLTKKDAELITKVLELHEKYIDAKIIQPIIKTITDYYDPIVNALKKIDDVELDVNSLKEWKKEAVMDLGILKQKDEENEKWKTRKRRRIERIEANFSLMEPERILEMRRYEKDIHELGPIITKFGAFLDWWNWKKIIAVIISFIILIGLLTWGIVWYSHKKHWVVQVPSKQSSYSTEYAYDKNGKQLRDPKPITRSIKLFDTATIKYTKQQRDSISDAIHERNQQEILKIIEENNKRLHYGGGGKAGT
ncbi:MAG: hypothetical protein PHQ91_15105 [Thermoanaerobaculaceae bacterium]|nr:hypothetical protein [Thermoanaerobaculaceae bacterium]